MLIFLRFVDQNL